jgi:NAD(P)-dependent dehydrogenase (short-subunit alcohol dehydrogenase family)
MEFTIMKIFCTGNPERKTIAWGLQQLGSVTTASVSTGWDFTSLDTQKRLRETILDYTVFVNSAYINFDNQKQLTDIVHSMWMQENIPGHIFNIGTTLENTDDNSVYANSKRQLRSYSVKLSDETGITGVKVSYLVVGGVGENLVTPVQIANTILWISQQKIRIPLIQLDSVKT